MAHWWRGHLFVFISSDSWVTHPKIRNTSIVRVACAPRRVSSEIVRKINQDQPNINLFFRVVCREWSPLARYPRGGAPGEVPWFGCPSLNTDPGRRALPRPSRLTSRCLPRLSQSDTVQTAQCFASFVRCVPEEHVSRKILTTPRRSDAVAIRTDFFGSTLAVPMKPFRNRINDLSRSRWR
jgi:hypothetical protein